MARARMLLFLAARCDRRCGARAGELAAPASGSVRVCKVWRGHVLSRG